MQFPVVTPREPIVQIWDSLEGPENRYRSSFGSPWVDQKVHAPFAWEAKVGIQYTQAHDKGTY
jgi:hypothetical protein